MKQFEYTIKDPLGIHARPAGMVVKVAKVYADTAITVSCNGKEAKAGSLMNLMRMGVKEGHTVTIRAEGPQEEAAIIAMSDFFQNNL